MSPKRYTNIQKPKPTTRAQTLLTPLGMPHLRSKYSNSLPQTDGFQVNQSSELFSETFTPSALASSLGGLALFSFGCEVHTSMYMYMYT